MDTGVAGTATTSEAGNYRFSSLPPGNYLISVEAANFQKKEVRLTLGTIQHRQVSGLGHKFTQSFPAHSVTMIKAAGHKVFARFGASSLQQSGEDASKPEGGLS